jgi:GAF domain-containing protein
MRGFDQSMVLRCLRLGLDRTICGAVAQARQALHVTDIQRSLDPRAEALRAEGVNACACEPLLVGERLFGTLAFATRARRCFSEDQIRLFRELARLIAAARERKSVGGSHAGRVAWLALEC